MADTKPSIDPNLSGQALTDRVAELNAEANATEEKVKAEVAAEKPATPAPVTTGPTGPTASSGTGYKTTKGIFNYNGSPFTGEYNGKYYNQGKIETDAQVKQDFLAKYSEQAKFIQSVPELSNLLSKAINENWSPTQWTTQFQGTNWAQAHPGDAGIAEIQRLSTPKLYNENYNNAYNRVQALASQLGIKLNAQQSGALVAPDQYENPDATKVDQNAIDNGQDIVGWVLQNPSASDQAIQQHMAKFGTIDPTAMGGTIASNVQGLKQYVSQMGINPLTLQGNGNNDWFNTQALGIAQGTTSIENAQGTIRAMAKQYFPNYADQIDKGATVADLASPYTSSLANLLEVSPSSIDLSSPTGDGALVAKALQSGQNLYDFQNQVRQDPRWLSTANARTSVLDQTTNLLRSFGFVKG